ncbi:VWFA and cache domain-containing protein 1-like [Anneissia japonica]|uniref:VWFA and cache domain-containing protein 1-like n=1 Tax=Anneissia japonica TaxID=1529436 RepID=UPI0014257B6E|nr:VWFA and cache domain-containing protein 1-like [Anneissia japonica]
MVIVGILFSYIILTCSICASTSESLDAVYLSNHLAILSNDVLGVQYMQDILNQHEYDTVPTEDGEALIDTLKDSLQYKYQNAIAVANELASVVKESFLSDTQSTWPQCCRLPEEGLEENPRFKQKTDDSQLCYYVSGTATSQPHILFEKAFDEMKRIENQYPNVLWQYFGSEEGALHQYPATASTPDCDSYDPRYRPWYVEAATPMPKDVVIVIDRSGSMVTTHKGRTLMNIAKEAAITVLKSMNQNDRVGFVAFSDKASTPEGGCHSQRLAQASALNTLDLEDEINNISPAGSTYYSHALNAAFDLIKNSPFPENQTRNQIIMFLTDGLPSDDKKTIMETLLRRSEETMFKIALLTFGFGERIDENTEILSDIALQNFEKYELTPNSLVGDRTIGAYTYVTDPDKLRASMATYYNYISNAGTFDDIIFTAPYVDAFGSGLLSSILKPVRIDGKLKGVVGTDIPVAEMFEDVTYFKQGEYSYAFLFDGKDSAQGRTLSHPLLPLPQAVTNDFSIYVHITTLERAPEFEEYVYKDAVSGGEGKRIFVADKIIARGDTFGEGVTIVSVSTTYYWRQIEETSIIVVLAFVEEEGKAQLKKQEVVGHPFIYHRIDLWTPSGVTICNHIGNYAITSSSAIYLNSDAFVEPTNYLAEQETSDLVQAYSAYMNDNDASRQNIFKVEMVL